MKKIIKFFSVALLALVINVANAQTADEIINKYFVQIGGKDKWEAIKVVKGTAKMKYGSQEFPISIIQKTPNAQKMSMFFQGKEIVLSSFDGNTGWATNQMTMKPEKMEAEDTENMKNEMDMPDPFLNYASKGYKISLEGEETVEGTACYKIKLTKKPIKVDGKEEENSTYYFFDKENNVPIMARSTVKKGQGKGMTQETVMSDYQEVNGVFMAFTVQFKYNGQVGQSIVMEKYEINPTLKDDEFAMPKN
jgi:hypothetical protein